MSDIIVIKAKLLLNTDDIKDVRGLEYSSDDEGDELSGKFLVRIFSKTPFIDLICNDITTAKRLYRNILKTRRVVDINEMRYGK